MLLTAKITARGPDTTCPDRIGAVQATVWAGEQMLGEVTLLPSPTDNELDVWGFIENWASAGLCDVLVDEDGRGDTDIIDAIVDAVRQADAKIIALCEDCVGCIGGACGGPDAEWRPALPGEDCEAHDCIRRDDATA